MSNSFVTPGTVTCQVPLSMEFPKKDTGMGWHFPLQGVFPYFSPLNSVSHIETLNTICKSNIKDSPCWREVAFRQVPGNLRNDMRWVPWFSFPCIYPTEKVMAPHSSTLAWKIPWMEEPGGLQSMGSLRVGHDWSDSAAAAVAAAYIPELELKRPETWKYNRIRWKQNTTEIRLL